MLNRAGKVHKRTTFSKPKIIVCVPHGATPVEKRAIRQIVCLDPGQREHPARVRHRRDSVRVGAKHRAARLIRRPGTRGGKVNIRVGIVQPTPIGRQQIAARRVRDRRRELAPRLGEEASHTLQEPVHLA